MEFYKAIHNGSLINVMKPEAKLNRSQYVYVFATVVLYLQTVFIFACQIVRTHTAARVHINKKELRSYKQFKAN
jgi:hypothetical protein